MKFLPWGWVPTFVGMLRFGIVALMPCIGWCVVIQSSCYGAMTVYWLVCCDTE